jgi:hypothetical protein
MSISNKTTMFKKNDSDINKKPNTTQETKSETSYVNYWDAENTRKIQSSTLSL